MYEYIFFDLDGTLTDPFIGITSSVKYALNKFDIEVKDLKDLAIFIGPPLYDSFTKFYNMSDEEAKLAIKYYRERYEVIGWSEMIKSELSLQLDRMGKYAQWILVKLIGLTPYFLVFGILVGSVRLLFRRKKRRR